MEAPFALRGYLAHTGSKYPTMNGIRLTSPSLEHKSVTRVTYTPSIFAGTSPSIVPPGSRALHGSRVLAQSSNGAFSNRPLSPHLALKKPQLSATYSISHRIFGAALASGIMLLPRLRYICNLFMEYPQLELRCCLLERLQYSDTRTCSTLRFPEGFYDVLSHMDEGSSCELLNGDSWSLGSSPPSVRLHAIISAFPVFIVVAGLRPKGRLPGFLYSELAASVKPPDYHE